MNLSPTETVKEKGRGEGEFKAPETGSYPSNTILSTLNSRMLRALRSPKSLIFFRSNRRYLRNRRARASHSIIWSRSSPSYFDSLSNLATGKDNSQSRLKRTYSSQDSDRDETTQRTLALIQPEQRRITIVPLKKKKSARR